jgi:hypothetical protein
MERKKGDRGRERERWQRNVEMGQLQDRRPCDSEVTVLDSGGARLHQVAKKSTTTTLLRSIVLSEKKASEGLSY